MRDPVLNSFLEEQQAAGLALAAASDILELFPLDGSPPGAGSPARHYVARFHCAGFVREATGEVREADQFDVGIRFPMSYLRQPFDPPEVLTWLAPFEVFHPNIRPPFVCPGHLPPGAPLADILYQLFEMITYSKLTMNESDALNPEACAWARRNVHRFPVDRRPLKRGAATSFQVEMAAAGEGARP